MTREASLEVRPASAVRRVGGLSVLERQLFTLSRAGIGKVRLLGISPHLLEGLRLPADLDVRWGPAEAGLAGGNPAVAVSGDHFIRVEALKSLLSRGASRADARTLPARDVISLDNPDSTLTSWLLEGVRKPHDGFMARHFDRHISLGITRLLLDTPLAPTHMTLISTGIGLAGAVQFLLIDHAHEILGASLIWLHTVLDGCDGEMARLTFRESRLGAVLDFWGDNAVHVALFTCMALDVAHDYPSALVFGALAGLGTLGSAWLAFKSRPETPPEAGRTRVGSLLRNMEVALAQRDFIYLLVLAAIFDRAEWFMWAAGIGTPLYLAGMIYLRLQASSRRAAGRKADLAPLEANELKSGLGV